ncbi:metaxin-1 isoform X2 [Callithrix jacchus]|uniref:metaxin-1 isoform X2 n=1 Tax=Callithrix jacchus TaxID=9483 RepID=UPI0004F076FD|nr:metaxin-1 isoform X2 [Callithrix jacchus]
MGHGGGVTSPTSLIGACVCSEKGDGEKQLQSPPMERPLETLGVWKRLTGTGESKAVVSEVGVKKPGKRKGTPGTGAEDRGTGQEPTTRLWNPTYARFTGAPLKVHKISNPWRSPSGTLPALRTSHGEVISVPHKIITHLRKEKYNADYDLSARQGADTLAFMSLLEEKLLPVLVHTFWIDTKNYVEVTRKWYAEAMPFPLNFFLPGRMQRQYMERLQLLSGEHRPEDEEELEKELYREARECLTLLSQRLGTQKFFFGDAPASLDAFVFSYLALLLQAKLPNGKLQAHLRGLHNLCAYCTHILSLYFPWDGAEVPPPRHTPAGPETEEEPYGRRNQILSVLAGLAAMVGYALLSGIVSIQRATPARAPSTRALGMAEEDEEE